jgi:hypothetical protein
MEPQELINGIKMEDWFNYHPPTTQDRRDAHAEVNAAAMDMAQSVLAHVQDEKCREMAFFAIQQARMFANQGITIDHLKKVQAEE